MRRTLLAVGFSIIISLLLFVPTRYYRFWETPPSSIAVTLLILQTVFLSVVAAVIVNIPWRRMKPASRSNPLIPGLIVLALIVGVFVVAGLSTCHR